MAITESRRLALFESARTSWGDETAQTLMDLLPPDPTVLASRSDLAVLGSDLRAEMAELRGDLRSEMADLRGDLRSEMAQQTRLLMITMLTTTVTIILAVLGAALAT